jgi:uncharacterized protein (DUF433 family)
MQIVDTIQQIPGVQGGYPVIAGTRTPVRTIVEMFCETHNGDIEAIAESLPHLSHSQIEAALDYYKSNPEMVDEDIARQRRARFAYLRP